MMQCPKCKTDVSECGSVEEHGIERPVFQCDRCVVVKEIFGEPFEVALTFMVDENGVAYDPVDEDIYE